MPPFARSTVTTLPLMWTASMPPSLEQPAGELVGRPVVVDGLAGDGSARGPCPLSVRLISKRTMFGRVDDGLATTVIGWPMASGMVPGLVAA